LETIQFIGREPSPRAVKIGAYKDQDSVTLQFALRADQQEFDLRQCSAALPIV
jgi:hypothetical protein